MERIFAGDQEDFVFFVQHEETDDIPALKFELACGHRVVLAFRECSLIESLDRSIWRAWGFLALRIYVAGEDYDNRIRRYWEFRGGIDFERNQVEKHWSWLDELINCDDIWEFDGVEDFVDKLCDHMAASVSEEDMVAHFHKLPGLCIPSIFDQWDDSISGESECEAF